LACLSKAKYNTTSPSDTSDNKNAIAEYFGSYKYSLWIAFLLSLVSLGLVVLYCALDKHAKRKFATLNGSIIHHEPPFRFLDAKAFSSQYWLWLTIAVSIYGTIFPFLAISSVPIMNKFDWKPEKVGPLLATIDITSLLLSPFFGWLVDRTGKRGYLVIIGNSLAVVGYFIMGFTYLHPMFATVLLGFHFCMMPAALWPCVDLLVKPHHVGIAFAIVSALINGALAGVTPLAALIVDHSGLTGLCLLFAGISSFSVLVAVIWNYRDKRSTRPILNVRLKEKA